MDVLRKKQTDAIEMAIEESESGNNFSDVNSDSEGDFILEELEDETESDSAVDAEESDQAEDVEPLPWVVTTRYGRHAGHWNLFQLK